MLGIVLGLFYLALPGSIFFPTLIICFIFLLGLLKPEYTFYMLIFVLVEEMVHIFINIPPLYIVTIYPYQIPLLATMLGIIVGKVARKEPTVQTPVTAILWIIAVCEIISILWAPIFSIGAWLSVIVITNIFLYYTTTNIVVNEKILRRATNVLIFAGIVSSTAIILSQWIDVEQTIYWTRNTGLKFAFQEQVDRPSGLGGVDHVAGFVSIALFMALGSMVYESRWKVKAIYFFLIIYMFYGIILTASRGVLIGVCGAYVFYIFVHSHFKGKLIRYTFSFFLLILFIILLVKPGFIDRIMIGFGYTGKLYFSQKEVYHGFEAVTELGEGLSGMEMRKIWWENGLNEMIEHPIKMLFGLGIGGFLYYSKGTNTVTSPEVSSVSFAFFYDLGIFGIIFLIILAYLIVSNLYYYIKNASKGYSYNMFLASTTAFISETVIHGLVDYDLNSYGSKYFWFPIAFNMAVLNIIKNKESCLHERPLVAQK